MDRRWKAVAKTGEAKPHVPRTSVVVEQIHDFQAGCRGCGQRDVASIASSGAKLIKPRLVSTTIDSRHGRAAPIAHKLLTRGVWFLLSLVVIGFGAMAWRFWFGLGATTHMNNDLWGFWIAMDVGSGIALAGGGFVGMRDLSRLPSRSAITCWLDRAGRAHCSATRSTYPDCSPTSASGGSCRSPCCRSCWQGNRVLFEVGMCVMIYLTVQYAELTPIICERLLGERWFARWPRVLRLTQFVEARAQRDHARPACAWACASARSTSRRSATCW